MSEVRQLEKGENVDPQDVLPGPVAVALKYLDKQCEANGFHLGLVSFLSQESTDYDGRDGTEVRILLGHHASACGDCRAMTAAIMAKVGEGL